MEIGFPVTSGQDGVQQHNSNLPIDRRVACRVSQAPNRSESGRCCGQAKGSSGVTLNSRVKKANSYRGCRCNSTIRRELPTVTQAPLVGL